MTLGFLLLGPLVIVVLLVLAGNFLFSVSGFWERMENREATSYKQEKISLGQFGPVVVGRRELEAGYQSYFGFAVGRTVWLKRRDYGVQTLVQQGFPKEIAAQLEGEVFSRYKLHLTKDRLFLEGVMIPYKIEFTHKPPFVTGMSALQPVSRKYRRIELVYVEDAARIGAVSK